MAARAKVPVTHAGMVRCAARWLKNSGGCSVVFTEYSTVAMESPDAIGFKGRWSILVECKVSRADFLADRKKLFRMRPEMGMGAQRYFMAPDGLLAINELPDKWGLLTVHGASHVRVVRESGGFSDRAYTHEIGFLTSMLRRAELRIGPGISLDGWLKWSPGDQPLASPQHPEGPQERAMAEAGGEIG